jgi:hypothetical protein
LVLEKVLPIKTFDSKDAMASCRSFEIMGKTNMEINFNKKLEQG